MSPTERLELDPRVLEGLRAENQGTKQSRVFRIESRVERANLIRSRNNHLPRKQTPTARNPSRA